MTLQIAKTVKDLRRVVADWRRAGQSVAVVPTMGALHEGHISLVRLAQARADRVIVTIFVNPKQFNSASDLAKYPRTDEADRAKLVEAGVDLLFNPSGDDMYPAGFATTVSVAGVSDGLCGSARPGHFDGVSTVVAKLFLQTSADFAFFGEKDFQQLKVVERMARDLDIPIEIIPCPTVREADGLAMSSRNMRLSPENRSIAPRLAAALKETANRIRTGVPVAEALAEGVHEITAAGFGAVDYLELRSADDLQPLTHFDRPARLLVAAWLGDIRLIDNIPV